MNREKAAEIIREGKRIVFFGGAGTSTESGIPDFRSSTGLYAEQKQKYSPEQLLSHSFFMDHPQEFYTFYKQKMIHAAAKPNRAHLALAELEKRGVLHAIVTQNIDGLHQMAGSSKVFELHGTVHRNYCMKCGQSHSLAEVMQSASLIPYCVCGGIVRPDVVLYEEGLDMDIVNGAIATIEQADVFIVAGTSLTVQPAAGLVQYYSGDKLLLINKSATSYDHLARYTIRDSIADVMHEAVFGN